MSTMELDLPYTVEPPSLAADWPTHACCCSAPPVVKVVMPPSEDRPHSVELFLCGHHYRASRTTLASTGATTAFQDRRTVVWWS